MSADLDRQTADVNEEQSRHPAAFQALYDAYRHMGCPAAVDPVDPDDCASVAEESVRVLTDAGLLLPVDATAREEWGCRLTWEDGHHEDTWLGERRYAQLRFDLHQQKRAENPGWRVTPTLIRRLHLTLPAETVEEES